MGPVEHSRAVENEQTLAISQPLTESGRRYNKLQDELAKAKVELKVAEARDAGEPATEPLRQKVAALTADAAGLAEPKDAYLWAAVVAVVTSVLLYVGRYRLIQFVATTLVAAFSAVTMATLIVLQTKREWAVTGRELMKWAAILVPAG